MDRSLWLLIGLQLRGWVRSLGRNLQSVRGALLALLGLFVLIPWLVLFVTQRGEAVSPERLRAVGPGFLLVYCLVNMLLSTGERAIYFSPAEVTFLFTGPFRRRELLAYKVVFALAVGLPTTLFLTAAFRVNAPWLLAVFVGVLLMVTFMQLFGMALNLAAASLGARLFSRVRKLMLGVALVAGVLALQPLQQGGLDAVLDSTVWRVVSTPLRWFFEAFLATTWIELLHYTVLGLLVDLALLGVVFGLDADYLEAAAAFSSRVYTQLQRLRGGPAFSGASDAPRPPPKPRFGLPMPPRLGGIGPLIWRQLTTAARSPGRFVGMVLMQALFAGAVFAGARETDLPAFLLMGIAAVVLSLFQTSMLPFDFRGDLDRLETLKTLPLPRWRIAVGQMLPPVLILSAFQLLLLAGLAAFELVHPSTGREMVAEILLLLLGCCLFAPPFNFLLIGLENVLFLLFPSRLMASTPGDFQAMGRVVLIMFAKFLTLGVVFGGMFGVGFIVYLLTDHNQRAACAATWPVLVVSAAAMVPVAAWAFGWIDLSRDKPA